MKKIKEVWPIINQDDLGFLKMDLQSFVGGLMGTHILRFI